MYDFLGLVGFLLLIISGVFLDTPFIALLAMPLFLIGFVLILIFYLNEIKHTQKLLSTFMIITGVVLFWIVAGYAAIEYNHYQGYLYNNPEVSWNWKNILLIAALNISALILIYFGIRKDNKYNLSDLLFLFLPIILVIPVTVFLIKLLVISGHWMGASL